MTLTPSQSLMLEAACDHLLQAGRTVRAHHPVNDSGGYHIASERYSMATDYLLTLLRRLEAEQS